MAWAHPTLVENKEAKNAPIGTSTTTCCLISTKSTMEREIQAHECALVGLRPKLAPLERWDVCPSHLEIYLESFSDFTQTSWKEKTSVLVVFFRSSRQNNLSEEEDHERHWSKSNLVKSISQNPENVFLKSRDRFKLCGGGEEEFQTPCHVHEYQKGTIDSKLTGSKGKT